MWLSFTFIILVVFAVFMIFFSEYSYIKTQQNQAVINDLKEQIKAREDSAALYGNKTSELFSDKETLEKVLREKYGKHDINEEVYKTEIK